jgi:hypothetical protein
MVGKVLPGNTLSLNSRDTDMPEIPGIGKYRFFFWSKEGNEPPHIHVKSAEDAAKFWLDPVTVSQNFGYTSQEPTKIENLVKTHQQTFLEAWNEYFNR